MPDIESAQIIIETVTGSSYFALVTFLVTVSALILAFLFHRKSKEVISLSHHTTTYNLIRSGVSKYEDLDILYKGSPLTDFSSTLVKIKNTGNRHIKGTDVAPADPIRIRPTGDNRILEASLLYEKQKSNNFSIPSTQSEEGVVVSFDFVNPEEYCIIQILHTGSNDSSLELTGSVAGQTKPFGPAVSKFSAGMMRAAENMMFFTIDPRRRKLQGALALLMSVLAISLAFLTGWHVVVRILLALFGTRGLYVGLRKIFFPSTIDPEELRLRIGAMAESASKDRSLRLLRMVEGSGEQADQGE